MKLINIRFNKKNISNKINKKSLNWTINYLKNSFILTKFNNLSKQQYLIQYYFELIDNKYSYFCPGINKNLSNQPYYVYDNI